MLGVDVSVVGLAFETDVDLLRSLWNPYTETWRRVTTWEGGRFGTHGGDAGFIMQGVSEDMDRFIGDYLRVNEAACSRAVLGPGEGHRAWRNSNRRESEN